MALITGLHCTRVLWLVHLEVAAEHLLLGLSETVLLLFPKERHDGVLGGLGLVLRRRRGRLVEEVLLIRVSRRRCRC